MFTRLVLSRSSLAVVADAFEITLHLPLNNAEELDASFWAIASPSSNQYLGFMNVDEIRDMIGNEDCVEEASG